jgi:hypothetical protein
MSFSSDQFFVTRNGILDSEDEEGRQAGLQMEHLGVILRALEKADLQEEEDRFAVFFLRAGLVFAYGPAYPDAPPECAPAACAHELTWKACCEAGQCLIAGRSLRGLFRGAVFEAHFLPAYGRRMEGLEDACVCARAWKKVKLRTGTDLLQFV